jgi:zinc protease
MRKTAWAAAALAAVAIAATATVGSSAPKSTDTSETLNIPYTLYRLDNGLTVILHEDHTQPLVVVDINVNVGSRDEKAKRTGFAHLFEHLMFMGTARVPEKKYDAWMEEQGGWNNAWTAEDRTDYFDVAPRHALPLLLWMEADRVSALGSEMDQHKLDAQRGVVKNERRQSYENRPYASVELRLPELLWPEGHPYHHPVIGSHADLEAAHVVDVKDFFSQWYVPANMSLVVAGDFDPAETKPLIERYFGALAKSTAPERTAVPQDARLTKVTRETMEDDVSLPKTIIAWLSPGAFKPGDAELDVLSVILSDGKASRLFKPLVYEQQIAQEVSAFQSSKQLQSHFSVEATAMPGHNLEEIEKVAFAEIERVRNEGVTEAELQRAKNQFEAGFVGRMQSLATRASLLNGYYAQHGNPGYVAADLRRYLDVTAADVQRVAREVLDPSRCVIMHVVPRKVQP